jgi:hypothetical protein
MDERQLNLFRGRRQRGERLPSPKEFNVHVALAALLRRATMPQWIWTHLPMGEKRDPVTASRLKAMGVMPGWPDFLFVGPGRVFFLELKRKGSGRPSEEQRDVAAHVIACGCGYLMTDDLDDAIGTLRDLGVVRASVSA